MTELEPTRTYSNPTATEEPLPCPFCGGSAKVECRWDGAMRWRVKCRNRRNRCAVHPKTPYDYVSKELAIQAWNMRDGDTNE